MTHNNINQFHFIYTIEKLIIMSLVHRFILMEKVKPFIISPTQTHRCCNRWNYIPSSSSSSFHSHFVSFTLSTTCRVNSLSQQHCIHQSSLANHIHSQTLGNSYIINVVIMVMYMHVCLILQRQKLVLVKSKLNVPLSIAQIVGTF